MNERQLKKLPLHRKVAVGHRLYFKRTDRAAGQWTFRYTRLNQTREMGLGPYPRISLKKAFELRDSYNAQLDNHEDPSLDAVKRADLGLRFLNRIGFDTTLHYSITDLDDFNF